MHVTRKTKLTFVKKMILAGNTKTWSIDRLLWRLQYKRWPCRGEQGGRQPGRAQNRARPSCLPHSGRTWGSTFVIQNTTNMYHLDHQRQMLPYSSTNGQYWQECILLSIIRLNFIILNDEILLCQVVHGVEPLVAKISLPTTLNCCRSGVVAQTWGSSPSRRWTGSQWWRW